MHFPEHPMVFWSQRQFVDGNHTAAPVEADRANRKQDVDHEQYSHAEGRLRP
jgi:hypothetical protein